MAYSNFLTPAVRATSNNIPRDDCFNRVYDYHGLARGGDAVIIPCLTIAGVSYLDLSWTRAGRRTRAEICLRMALVL